MYSPYVFITPVKPGTNPMLYPMNINFCNLDYLKSGNPKQKAAYKTLERNAIMQQLDGFDPILVGTIPIGIDIEDSDLDIICHSTNLHDFAQTLTNKFSHFKGFTISAHEANNSAVVAQFVVDNFILEIFGQALATRQQNAYRHMLIEHQLLLERGENFRQEIIALKEQGYKTEPAFALLLGLTGDPYAALLNYASRKTDSQLNSK